MCTNKTNFKKKWPLFILLIPVAIVLFGALVMSLWNNILPAVIGVNPITFWQALGILLLSRLLFGGFGGRRGKPHFGGSHVKEAWTSLTEEERERLKETWKKKLDD